MSLSDLVAQTEDADIAVFNPQDDLFSSDSLVQRFNQRLISNQIDCSAYRAKMVVDAQAQLLLARFQAESPDQVITHHDKAESIAYDLGRHEYNGIDKPNNPFEDEALSNAWDNGYTRSAHHQKPLQQIELEKKVWEQGIETDSENSQFELAAIALYELALRTKNSETSARCKRLAFEMASYDSQHLPTPKRQHQLNLFMARQTERIANEIDWDT
ncbi:MAG: hypothetical protein MI976_20980 [Pseudomonadales bacterium]|nr:hypothetical protein [Pseudomonadales bacterium]